MDFPLLIAVSSSYLIMIKRHESPTRPLQLADVSKYRHCVFDASLGYEQPPTASALDKAHVHKSVSLLIELPLSHHLNALPKINTRAWAH